MLAVNSIRKDLLSLDETHVCLALHAIATIAGREMAESLHADVYRALVSPDSQPWVQKKAALTLLRLYRKHPHVIPFQEWPQPVIDLLKHADLGVVTSVASLITALVQDHLQTFIASYPVVVQVLTKVYFALILLFISAD